MTGVAAPTQLRVSRLAAPGGARRRGSPMTPPLQGLCVHTTGSGPATKALALGKAPLQVALDYYVHGGEGFPHYVVDYDGTLHAVCDETEVAWHAGWYARGGRARWRSWAAPTWWSSVWSPFGVRSPADLLPARAGDPNSVFLGVELLGDAGGWGFTAAQYDTLARLVADVFHRYALPLTEPVNPRLLGHEDLEPVDRANSDGGWDPGAHRRVPKFSWAALWASIQALGGSAARPAEIQAPPPLAPAVPPELAVALARGERDPGRLTDLVFHARHPERAGRRIDPGDSATAQEWFRIRDGVVLPLLRAKSR